MTWPSRFSALLVLSAVAALAHGVPESSFAKEYTAHIQPFYESGEAHNLDVGGDVKIAYRTFWQPVGQSRGTVVVAEGYSETMSKYAEVAYDLHQAGFAVVLYDHRGQGLSTHLLGDPQRAYIDNFENLVTDLKALRDQVVRPHDSGPYLLLANSMGGAVSARYLEEYPQDFRAAVLCAPMIDLPMTWMQRTFYPPLFRLLGWFHLDHFYVRGPHDPMRNVFARNRVTHSRVRHDTLELDLVRQEPQAQVWGITAGWLAQADAGMRAIRANAGALTTPVLLLQAEDERFVDLNAQVRFCDQAPHCAHRMVSGSRHEILMETDALRAPVMEQITDFLKR